MEVKHPYGVLKQFCIDLIGYEGVYAFQTVASVWFSNTRLVY